MYRLKHTHSYTLSLSPPLSLTHTHKHNTHTHTHYRCIQRANLHTGILEWLIVPPKFWCHIISPTAKKEWLAQWPQKHAILSSKAVLFQCHMSVTSVTTTASVHKLTITVICYHFGHDQPQWIFTKLTTYFTHITNGTGYMEGMCMCVCVCVCACVCTSVCVYCVHACMYVWVRGMYVHVCVFVLVCMCVCVHMRAPAYVCLHACKHVCMHSCLVCPHCIHPTHAMLWASYM